MDKTAVCTLLGINWRTVGTLVQRVVTERVDPSRLDGLYVIGVDAISFRRHHQYVTCVVDHLKGRVVWTGEGKSAQTLGGFFDALFILAFGAFSTCGPTWLAGFYHYGGLIGVAATLTAWIVVRREERDLGDRPWLRPLIACTSVAVLWGVFWLVLFLLLRGNIDPSAYPAAASSPFVLPFPGGDSAWVIQGNHSSLNHNGTQEFAWDFRRQCGTPVLAARAGQVIKVDDSHDGHGKDKPNNEIHVRHDDGTVARYLHIQQGSAKLKPPARVNQGDELAKVGNVGNSLTGHIHFVVQRGSSSIPVTFKDVPDDSGIPRTFSTYKSGNR